MWRQISAGFVALSLTKKIDHESLPRARRLDELQKVYRSRWLIHEHFAPYSKYTLNLVHRFIDRGVAAVCEAPIPSLRGELLH